MTLDHAAEIVAETLEKPTVAHVVAYRALLYGVYRAEALAGREGVEFERLHRAIAVLDNWHYGTGAGT